LHLKDLVRAYSGKGGAAKPIQRHESKRLIFLGHQRIQISASSQVSLRGFQERLEPRPHVALLHLEGRNLQVRCKSRGWNPVQRHAADLQRLHSK
jgi:hypothetical protein